MRLAINVQTGYRRFDTAERGLGEGRHFVVSQT